ncbi:hypothetical protein GCM10020229_15180 [Kitasatospora albolonga]
MGTKGDVPWGPVGGGRRWCLVRRGLVLGGGGVLGAAWAVGALRAVEEETGWRPGERR